MGCKPSICARPLPALSRQLRFSGDVKTVFCFTLRYLRLAAIFDLADKLNVAIVSVGGTAALTKSYRTGYGSEADRRSLIGVGAVGDVFYNFIDAAGKTVDHAVNCRVISVNLSGLRRMPERILISGGKDKRVAMRAAIKTLDPTTLITDEQSARSRSL